MLGENGGGDLVQAMCDEMRVRGYRRVILLGSEGNPSYAELKRRLVRASVLVLTPGPADRAWVASLMIEPEAIDETAFSRLQALLADGIEHGVEAVVVSEGSWAAPVRAVVDGVPVLSVADAKGEDR